VSVEVTASSSTVTATATGSAVQAAVGSTIVSASSSGGIGPQGPQGEPGEGGGGGDGDYLPLAGGTMTGNIVFDETGGQFIGKGLVDTQRGGSYGISLVCSVGYQFNWQAGWILATEQNGSTPRPLYLDSAAGTTLRVWDAAEDEGLEVAHDGITFSDDTEQTTAWTGGVAAEDVTGLATVATSGSYDDLDDLPTTYTRLSDTVSNVSYLGLAPAGSATSASAWRIKRTAIAAGGTVSSSVTATNVAWNDRLTASYS
jgi:hypothetical protein